MQRAQVRDGPVADTQTPSAPRRARRPNGAGQVVVAAVDVGPVLTARHRRRRI